MEVTSDRKLVDVLKGSRVMAVGLPQSLGSVHIHIQVCFADWKSDGQHERQSHPAAAGQRGLLTTATPSCAPEKAFPGWRRWPQVRPSLQQAEGPPWVRLVPSSGLSTLSQCWNKHCQSLAPRPTPTSCWPARCFLDAHRLTGYFLVLLTRKSSGPFLPLDVNIIVWGSQGNLFPSASQGLPSAYNQKAKTNMWLFQCS